MSEAEGLGLTEDVLNVLRRRYAPPVDWTKDPVGWVVHTQPDEHLWSKQREIMEAVRDHRRTAVKACHSAGKTRCAAQVAAWWVEAHLPGDALVVSSAPTAQQVRDILWKELNHLHRTANLQGRMNLTNWYDATGALVAFGRKPSDDDPTAFQGHHAPELLVLLDESCGIPKLLWEAAESLASNDNARILAIGNPDDGNAHFATIFDDAAWHRISIPAAATPNFTGEDVPERVKKVLLGRKYVDDLRERYGERSPIYVSKVLAQFPQDATDGVVPSSWLARCQYQELTEAAPCEAGLDVAAGGADRSVLAIRKGPVAVERQVLAGESDPLALAEWVLTHLQRMGVERIKVDAIGVGWAIGGIIEGWGREGRHTCEVVPVTVSERADDPEQYVNLRAEIWWSFREACRLQQYDLRALGDDDIAEITAVRYRRDKGGTGRILIERKDELKKRLGVSPDLADAWLLAFHEVSFSAESYVSDVTQARLPSAPMPTSGRGGWGA